MLDYACFNKKFINNRSNLTAAHSIWRGLKPELQQRWNARCQTWRRQSSVKGNNLTQRNTTTSETVRLGLSIVLKSHAKIFISLAVNSYFNRTLLEAKLVYLYQLGNFKIENLLRKNVQTVFIPVWTATPLQSCLVCFSTTTEEISHPKK
jgi:hypothetical protein